MPKFIQNPPIARFAAAAVRLTLLLLAIASVYYLLSWQQRLPVSNISFKGSSQEDTSVKAQLAALLDRLPFIADKHGSSTSSSSSISNSLNNLSSDPVAMQSFAIAVAKEVERLLNSNAAVSTVSSSSSSKCPVCSSAKVPETNSLPAASDELENMETIGWRTGNNTV